MKGYLYIIFFGIKWGDRTRGGISLLFLALMLWLITTYLIVQKLAHTQFLHFAFSFNAFIFH